MMKKWTRFSSQRRSPAESGQPDTEPAPAPREDVVSLEIYEATLRGERSAINQFGLAVLPLIRSAVQSILRGSAASKGLIVEDLVHDVFVMLLDNDRCALRKWDPDRGRSLRGFLYVFARLRAIDRLRAHAHGFPRTDLVPSDDRLLYAAADPAMFERAELKQFLEKLQARLPEHLSPEQQLLLELTLQEVPGEEIAEVLKKTTANVFQIRKRIRDILINLRDQIFGEDPAPPPRARRSKDREGESAVAGN